MSLDLTDLMVGEGDRVTESHVEAPLLPVSSLFVRTQDHTSTIAFQKIVLGAKSKKLCQDTSEPNNISFDSDANEERENIDPSSQVFQSHRLMSGSLQILGSLAH